MDLYRVVHPNRGMLYFLLAAAIILLIVFWYSQLFVIEQEQELIQSQPLSQEVQQAPANPAGVLDTSNWKTYRNEEYGFEFKYPGDWGFNQKEALLTQPGTDLQEEHPFLQFDVFQLQPGQDFSKLSEFESINIAQDCQKINFSGKLAYECKPLITFSGERDFIIQISGRDALFVFDSIENITSQNIVSTLTFFEPKR